MLRLNPLALLRHRREVASIAIRVTYTGLAFLVTVLLARLLNSAELGKYFEILAWVLLITSAVQTGWAPYLVREVAALRECGRRAELVGACWLATRIVGGASVAAAILMIAVAHFAGTGRESMQLVWLAAPMIPLLSTSSMRQAITLGMGRPFLGQICDILVRPGVQVVGLILWWLGVFDRSLGPPAAIAIFLVAVAGSAALAFLLERHATARVRKTAEPEVASPSQWLAPLSRIALMAWSSAVNLQIGTLILANVGQNAQVATFRIAQQLSLLMALGLSAVGTLYAADLSRSFARRDFRWTQRLASKGAFVGIATALPLALVYIAFGGQIIRLLFGAQYSNAYLPLLVMTFGQLANAGFGLAPPIAVAARSETAALRAYTLGALSNVVICAVLAPWMGAVGAAIASAVALMVWNLLLYTHLKRHFGVNTLFSFGLMLRQFRTNPSARTDLLD